MEKGYFLFRLLHFDFDFQRRLSLSADQIDAEKAPLDAFSIFKGKQTGFGAEIKCKIWLLSKNFLKSQNFLQG